MAPFSIKTFCPTLQSLLRIQLEIQLGRIAKQASLQRMEIYPSQNPIKQRALCHSAGQCINMSETSSFMFRAATVGTQCFPMGFSLRMKGERCLFCSHALVLSPCSGGTHMHTHTEIHFNAEYGKTATEDITCFSR